MFVKADTNRFINIRQFPQMGQIAPTMTNEFLVLNAPGMPEFKVIQSHNSHNHHYQLSLQNTGKVVTGVSVWKFTCDAIDEGKILSISHTSNSKIKATKLLLGLLNI